MEKIKILLIEDDREDAFLIMEMFAKARSVQFKIECVDRLAAGLERLEEKSFDVILLDLGLPDSHGLETLKKVVSRPLEIPVIVVLTGLADEEAALTALQQGAQDYLIKGQVDSNLLIRSVRYAMERKQGERRLQKTTFFLENLIETASAIILTLDAEGKIVTFNQYAETLTGYVRDEVIGIIWFDKLIPKQYLSEVKYHFASIFDENSKVCSLETPVRCKNGTERIFEWSNSLLKDDEGNQQGVLCVGIDISDRKSAETRLKEYSEELEGMVEERTRELRTAQEKLLREEKLAVLGRLAGGVAHELRNPLGVISNAVFFLKTTLGNVETTTSDYLNILSSEVLNTERIVSELLDFSRVGTANRKTTQVSYLFERTINKYPLKDTVQIDTEIENNVPPVFVDTEQIVQVLGNLVINGSQAMPEGGALSLRAGIEKNCVRISVSDTGTGISQENLSKIFEPLFTTRARGIGLGLALSKNLLEANEGTIEVSSEEGKGSVFTITVPIAK